MFQIVAIKKRNLSISCLLKTKSALSSEQTNQNYGGLKSGLFSDKAKPIFVQFQQTPWEKFIQMAAIKSFFTGFRLSLPCFGTGDYESPT